MKGLEPILLARLHPAPLVHPAPASCTQHPWFSWLWELPHCPQTGLLLCGALAGSSYIMYLLGTQARNHYVRRSLLTS